MSYPNTLEICRSDLFTSESELLQKYPANIVDKIKRIREMYNWQIANPERTDREFIAESTARHGISRPTAYSDLAVVKALLPALSTASRDYHRWRTNEMLLATYRMAERRKDTKTMERCASAYGKLNRVDLEDEQQLPFDLIVKQPFTATDDPRTLGIEPIKNLQQKIDSLLAKYRAESIDIDDVDFEDVDLEFDSLFPNNSAADDRQL